MRFIKRLKVFSANLQVPRLADSASAVNGSIQRLYDNRANAFRNSPQSALLAPPSIYSVTQRSSTPSPTPDDPNKRLYRNLKSSPAVSAVGAPEPNGDRTPEVRVSKSPTPNSAYLLEEPSMADMTPRRKKFVKKFLTSITGR